MLLNISSDTDEPQTGLDVILDAGRKLGKKRPRELSAEQAETKAKANPDKKQKEKDGASKKRLKFLQKIEERREKKKLAKKEVQESQKKIVEATNEPGTPPKTLKAMKVKQLDVEEVLTYHDKTFEDLQLSKELSGVLTNSIDDGGLGFTQPTLVQQRAVPIILSRRDCLIKSQTGSGKTLAFGLPILHILHQKPTRISREDGISALILSPTRELCFQLAQVFERVSRPFHWIVTGALVGGEKRKTEKARIRKGVNILVATPGRLLDHLEHTETLQASLKKDKLEWLVLDEADRLTDGGFIKQVNSVLDWLDRANIRHRKPQTVLLSATLDENVQKLAERVLSSDAVTVDMKQSLTDSQLEKVEDATMNDHQEKVLNSAVSLSMPKTLMQHYILVNSKERLVTLGAFILRQVRKYHYNVKFVLFVSCRAVVDFLYEVMPKLSWPPVGPNEVSASHRKGLGTSWWKLHGSVDAKQRRQTISGFSRCKGGVLICTDVAARGLDLPHIDWIIQYDPPSEISEYVHRVGRTARSGQRGSALLFLTPDEKDYLKILESKDVRLTEMRTAAMFTALSKYAHENQEETVKKPSPSALSKLPLVKQALYDGQAAASLLQITIEDMVDPKTPEGGKKSGSSSSEPANDEADRNKKTLKMLAQDAFIAFIRAYAVHSKETKIVFHPKKLHLGHVARSFGLRQQPTGISGQAKERFKVEEGKRQRKQEKALFKKKGNRLPHNGAMSEFVAF